MRGRGVGEEEPTHLLYNPRQAREAEGEGEIKNHRPHTTIHRLPTVHPRGSPQLPVPLHSFLSLSRSLVARTTLCLRYRAARGDTGQKRPTRVWWSNSVRIGFPIERSLMASGHASKPRVATICEMESQRGHRVDLFFFLFPVPWDSPEGGKFSHRCLGVSPPDFCTTRPTSVGAVPSLSIGWSCAPVRRQSSI